MYHLVTGCLMKKLCLILFFTFCSPSLLAAASYSETKLTDKTELLFHHYAAALFNFKKKLQVSLEGSYPSFDRGDRYVYGRDISYGLDGIDDIHLSYEYLLESNDWDSLVELNNDSHRLWKKLLKTTNLHKSYEELNRAYLKGNKLHSKRKIRKELEKEIINFKKKVYDYLSSGSVHYTYGASLVDQFHPFFVQVLVEIFSKSFLYAGIDRRRFDAEQLQKDSLILYGSILGDEELIGNILRIENIDESLYRKREFKGSLVSLIAMVASNKNCDQIGLLPEVSLNSLIHFKPVIYELSVNHIFTNIQQNLIYNCFLSPTNFYNSAIGSFNKSYLKLVRKRAEKDLRQIDWKEVQL
ncbi:hypothetical protein [Halobacteriovorax sp. GB3]|uniref:hypothetical protein n=1 Tax=Halobacteriovorax sp. GB3 TaxID=2719615 RepID=UPI0023607269|nr:hypothetical protein [Halobacteriovorax sp. GB3]